MRDRYYRLTSETDPPQHAALVRIYRRDGRALARLDGDAEREEAEPDLILFRAALTRLRHELVGIFVAVEDDGLWRDDWGDLVPYRGTRRMEKPAPLRAPAMIAPDLMAAWDYTLNLNSMTSPSLTT